MAHPICLAFDMFDAKDTCVARGAEILAMALVPDNYTVKMDCLEVSVPAKP